MSPLLERQHFTAEMSPHLAFDTFATKILWMQLLPHVLPAPGRGPSNSVGPLILAQERHCAYWTAVALFDIVHSCSMARPSVRSIMSICQHAAPQSPGIVTTACSSMRLGSSGVIPESCEAALCTSAQFGTGQA